VYASPNQNGVLILDRLALIEPDAACKVRVSQAMIHNGRKALVDTLVTSKRGGCAVWVAGNNIDAAMRRRSTTRSRDTSTRATTRASRCDRETSRRRENERRRLIARHAIPRRGGLERTALQSEPGRLGIGEPAR
jgi:hypothetical protein